MSLALAVSEDLIIDASVGVKWLIPEILSAEADRLMTKEIRRHVPTLFYTEVSQTIWKKDQVRREIAAEDARELFRRLRMLPIKVHPVDPLIDSSFEIALETGRSVYDSIYLALAARNGWKCVTADEKLYNGLKGSRYEASLIWLADFPAH